MKRPAFQFYAKDWRGNLKLRRCSDAAKGAWIEIMCVLHDSEEYGVARFPLKELVAAAGVQMKSAKELVEKDVLKGGDRDVPAYTYTPRHAGKAMATVTLLDASEGPMWYCSRFVRDEYIRLRRGQASWFDSDNQPTKAGPKPAPKVSPMPPIGERHGDGSAVAVASALPSQAVSTVTGYGDQPAVDNPAARERGRPNPPAHARLPARWKHDPSACDKAHQLLLGKPSPQGKSHDECVRIVEQELARRERDAA